MKLITRITAIIAEEYSPKGCLSEMPPRLPEMILLKIKPCQLFLHVLCLKQIKQ